MQPMCPAPMLSIMAADYPGVPPVSCFAAAAPVCFFTSCGHWVARGYVGEVPAADIALR
jgi:hypothetical protein